MRKKYLRKKKLSKAIREWMEELIKEEMRHGTSRLDAEKVALEVIHILHIDEKTKKH